MFVSVTFLITWAGCHLNQQKRRFRWYRSGSIVHTQWNDL